MSSARSTMAVWSGDFYSPGFPRHLYRVVRLGYCCVHVVLAKS